MKTLSLISLYSLTAMLFGCFSACIQYATFTESEFRFARPYSKTDTAIYKSATGLMDTIIFHSAILDTVKVRSIEQGFYNNIRLRVSYWLTNYSYHQFTVKAKNDEPDNFIQFAKAKGSYQSKEIAFLGMVFSDEYLDNMEANNQNEITFKESNATYNAVNINEGIKSFVFDLNRGVTSFVDNNNIRWNRRN